MPALDKQKEKVISKHSNFNIVNDNGTDYIVFKAEDNTKLRVLTINALKAVAGAGALSSNVTKLPLRFLVENHNKVHGYLNSSYKVDQNYEGFTDYYQVMNENMVALEEEFQARFSRGSIELDDVPFMIKIGDELVTQGEIRIGGIVKSVRFVTTFMSSYWSIGLSVIHNLQGKIEESVYNFRIPSWNGLKEIDSLPFIMKSDTDTSDLEKRGKIFTSVAGKASYIKYTGDIVRVSWTGAKSFRADGRLMIDPRSFKTIDPTQYRNEQEYSGITFGNNNNGFSYDEEESENLTNEDIAVTEKDYWRVYPYTFGFSFRCKKWGTILLDNITPIVWKEDSFDLLVLDEAEKNIIKALVLNSSESFTDIIDEKGGGVIFMLYGPPGQGKTLTAETVAELSHKPLYSVSVGELGTNPSELEEKLRVILDLSTIWNSVLLLDEADIFLEARDTKDIVRNAMVGVFLRLLEYHQGTLFLTTNRVKNIDHAFFSRISVPLNFPGSDFDKRLKIWTNLITAAGFRSCFTDKELNLLSEKDVNGRQIKNAIRIGQTLAKSENEKLSIKNILQVLEMGERFQTVFNEYTAEK